MRIDQFVSGDAIDRLWDVLLLVGSDGSILDANPAALRCYGYSHVQMLSMNMRDIRAQRDPDSLDASVPEALEQLVPVETLHRRSDGTLFPVEVRSASVSVAGETALLTVVHDITKRKRAEEALLASQQIVEGIINAIPVRVFWKDLALVYEGCNAVFAADAGCGDPKDIIGKDDYEMVWRDQADLYRADDRQVIESGCSKLLIEEVQTTPEGNTIALLTSKIPLRSPEGEVIGVLGTYLDITERKEAEDEILRLNSELEERVAERTEELRSANEELISANEKLNVINAQLEEATRAKSDFLAAMSHELRTPLNSIIGFSGTMLQGLAGALSQEQGKQLAMINKSGRHLLELINEVLDLARIEAAENRPTIRDVDVGRLARETFDTLRPMGEAKDLEMRCACPDGLRPVPTDGRRVGQILLNLIGNAIKFTEHGYVNVTVSHDGSGARVSVEDTGPGIAAADLKRVFDDFYQVVPHDGGKSRGTGLGLAVSNRLARSMGAEIEVTSAPGRGSVFTLRVPGRLG